MSGARPRRRPCSTCPYRLDAPSGLWAAEEYDRLPPFDGTTTQQGEAGLTGAFYCHTGFDAVCAGWAGCHDMSENLAARIGVALSRIDPSIFTYTTTVALHPSGAAAAAHGKRDLAKPGPQTIAAARKLQALLTQGGRK